MTTDQELEALLPKVVAHAPSEAVAMLSSYPDNFIANMLTLLNPNVAQDGSCLISGIFGASIPILMRKIGTDPATASSIILTTITDVATLAVFLAFGLLARLTGQFKC